MSRGRTLQISQLSICVADRRACEAFRSLFPLPLTPRLLPHLQYSSAALLLPGGTGGGSCNGGGGGGGIRVVRNGSTRTQSPSPVSQEGSASATLAGHSISGGYPVRHRGMPKSGGGADGSGSERDADGGGGGGTSRGGRWVRRKQLSPPRSPLRNRIASPPVTGLGFMVA